VRSGNNWMTKTEPKPKSRRYNLSYIGTALFCLFVVVATIALLLLK
jgi:hypothetical protein